MLQSSMFVNKRKKLGELLIEEGLIVQEQLDAALEAQKGEHRGEKVGAVIVSMGMATEEQIVSALVNQLKYPRIDLSAQKIPEEIINIMDEQILRKYNIMPFGFNEKNPNILKVGMSDPLDIRAVDDVSLITGFQLEIYITTHRDVILAIDRNFGNSEANRVADEFLQEREAARKERGEEDQQANDELEQAPIVKLVRQIIEQGVRKRASDIHIEALEDKVRVRFRIDGVLKEEMTQDISIHPALSARVKIISGLDIAEKRKPQDGRATAIVDREEFDIRVSILPTVYGEKIVMRLTKKLALTRDKSELGFKPNEMERFEKILSHPNGIILVTGPTGSGKSTTLYTALSELNVEGVNIITVEDPVEANIRGINQVQTNEKAGLTFSSALRSILRQDPDIIMIGEIRDGETADIAVKASITGHLVVSTLHTNSSASTISRLADMGVENYLIADSVVGIIAQRLVRRVCPACSQLMDPTDEDLEVLGISRDQAPKIHVACHKDDCMTCGGTGYKGRIGVYEIMPITAKIRGLITAGANADAIEKGALEEGMHTLRQSAIEYVLQGVTTVEEVRRITYED